MSPLRKRMTDEMVLRGLCPRTQESYLCCVEGLARYHGRSPDQLSNGAVTVRHRPPGAQRAGKVTNGSHLGPRPGGPHGGWPSQTPRPRLAFALDPSSQTR